MKLLRDIQPETDFIKGLFGWLGFEKTNAYGLYYYEWW